MKSCFTGRCTTVIWSSEKNEQKHNFSLKNLSIPLFNKVFSDHNSWGQVHTVSNIFKLEYVTKHTFPVKLPSLPWMSSLVEWVSFGFVLGLGFFLCVCVFLFLELLSLLVIHLCKHYHYQPQHSLWLTLWYMRCSLQRANTNNRNGSDLLQLILYDREKKICRAAARSKK